MSTKWTASVKKVLQPPPVDFSRRASF